MTTLLDELKSAWDYVSTIEPALGKISRDELRRVEGSIAAVEGKTAELDELDDESLESAQSAIAILYARGAAIATAAGAADIAQRWFDTGQEHAVDEAYAAQFMDGRRDPERFRKLVQGRWQIANHRESSARKLWREVVKANNSDAIAMAANAEQKAPRALNGASPSLWTYNGIGVGFSGSRDRWSDGSYCTTHCFKIFYIPIIPLSAYRVRDGEESNQYYIMAREQLSPFARGWRWALLGMIVLGITWAAISSHLNDPERLAKQRWDASMERVAKAKPEDALRELDERMKDYDLWRVGRDRVEQAGAEVVKLAAGMVKKPFTKDALDQAGRVVRRYEALPTEARGGAARDAMLAALDRWTTELGDSLDTADARLELLRHAEGISDETHKGTIAAKVEATRLAAADAKVETAPLDALAMYVERPTTEALARANKIVEKLAESPALLVDAGQDLRTWIGAVAADNPLRQRVQDLLAAGTAARDEAQAEKLTTKQLDAMLKRNPWNQWATLALANQDIEKGKLEPAAARLRAIGKPGAMIRDVRHTLGQLSSALGKLDEADELFSGLLGGRLARFAKVAAELEATQQKLVEKLKTGRIPYDLQVQLDRAPEDKQRELVSKWLMEQMENDSTIKALREEYLALGDIVPTSLAAGTVKLRRAQAMSGAARDAMLAEAERMFLAIRTEAEGQPEFRIGLGEVYARLGKTKESEEQFAGVLEMNQPELSLRVARVYRNIGSTERAKKVAKDVFESASSPTKDNAAMLLGIMSDTRGEEEEAEKWFRKADQKDSMVKTSLLELEARRLLRNGKYTECATKYALVAKQHLANASAMDIASYNNAALAHQAKFACNGDPAALAEAEATLEKAYRVKGDEPIVVANLAEMHDSNGTRRVLAKRVDLRALHGATNDLDTVVALLLGSSERDALLADLNADASVRRSGELFKQYEVLAPNSTNAYEKLMAYAAARRDEAALAALLERVKRAKGLDTSETARTRDRFIKGEFDEQVREQSASTIERIDTLLAKGKLDAKTRAVALVTMGNTRIRSALYEGNIPVVAAGREALQQAGKLWPALHAPSSIIAALIDEAALEADAKTWIEMRRVYSAVAALDKLATDKSPIAAKVRASKQWSEIHAVAQTDTGRPGIDDLRIARLLGDTALETRAKAVLDDKLVRLSSEIERVLDPTSTANKEDLAYLDRR